MSHHKAAFSALAKETHPKRQQHIFEAHPELAFAEMNGQPLMSHKRSNIGQEQRLELLKDKTRGVFPHIESFCEKFLEETPRKLFALDDLLDACALVWVAWRHAHGKASCVPKEPAVDARGLKMEIWY